MCDVESVMSTDMSWEEESFASDSAFDEERSYHSYSEDSLSEESFPEEVDITKLTVLPHPFRRSTGENNVELKNAEGKQEVIAWGSKVRVDTTFRDALGISSVEKTMTVVENTPVFHKKEFPTLNGQTAMEEPDSTQWKQIEKKTFHNFQRTPNGPRRLLNTTRTVEENVQNGTVENRTRNVEKKRTDLLCGRYVNHDRECRMAHSLEEWEPKICRYPQCRRGEQCRYQHSTEDKVGYLKRLCVLPDSHYEKYQKLYRHFWEKKNNMQIK